jgi:hypothetical protein
MDCAGFDKRPNVRIQMHLKARFKLSRNDGAYSAISNIILFVNGRFEKINVALQRDSLKITPVRV